MGGSRLRVLTSGQHVLEATRPDAPNLLSARHSDSDSRTNEKAQLSKKIQRYQQLGNRIPTLKCSCEKLTTVNCIILL